MRARWRLIACAGYAPLGLVRTMHRLKADGFKVAAIRPLQGDGLPTKYPIANGKSVKGFFVFTMVFWKLQIMTGAHGVVVSHPLACGRPWVQSPVCPSHVRKKQDVQVTVRAKREISRTQPPVQRLPVERKGLNLVGAHAVRNEWKLRFPRFLPASFWIWQNRFDETMSFVIVYQVSELIFL